MIDIFFVSQLDGVYQTSQKLIAKHLMKSCVRIPDSIRQELFRLRRRGIIFKTSPEGGGKKYWATQMGRDLKVIETDHGLVFDPSVPITITSVTRGSNDVLAAGVSSVRSSATGSEADRKLPPAPPNSTKKQKRS